MNEEKTIGWENTVTLNSGYDAPLIGFGTWAGYNEEDKQLVAKAVRHAIDAGCRHFDFAEFYRNQAYIGEVLKETLDEGVVAREDLFLTSKVWNSNHHPENVRASCLQTLEHLQVDYLDLLLVHWPVAWAYCGLDFSYKNGLPYTEERDAFETENVTLRETWQAMEQLVKDGLVRSIGVSNYTVPLLADMLTYCEIPPAVNQVELHPFLVQEGLVQFCQHHGIQVTGYCPLARPGRAKHNILEEKTIDDIVNEINADQAEEDHVNAGQVVLRWGLQRNVIVVPKSSTPSRIAKNTAIGDSVISLNEDQMARISGLDCDFRICNLRFSGPNIGFGASTGRSIYE